MPLTPVLKHNKELFDLRHKIKEILDDLTFFRKKIKGIPKRFDIAKDYPITAKIRKNIDDISKGVFGITYKQLVSNAKIISRDAKKLAEIYKPVINEVKKIDDSLYKILRLLTQRLDRGLGWMDASITENEKELRASNLTENMVKNRKTTIVMLILKAIPRYENTLDSIQELEDRVKAKRKVLRWLLRNKALDLGVIPSKELPEKREQYKNRIRIIIDGDFIGEHFEGILFMEYFAREIKEEEQKYDSRFFSTKFYQKPREFRITTVWDTFLTSLKYI